MRELGGAAPEDGTCYLTGGATAVLVGWRATTVDVDIELEPDQDAPVAQGRPWVEQLRKVWHTAIRWPMWPVTVIVAAAVVGALIYVAVGLIAGFFDGIVE